MVLNVQHPRRPPCENNLLGHSRFQNQPSRIPRSAQTPPQVTARPISKLNASVIDHGPIKHLDLPLEKPLGRAYEVFPDEAKWFLQINTLPYLNHGGDIPGSTTVRLFIIVAVRALPDGKSALVQA